MTKCDNCKKNPVKYSVIYPNFTDPKIKKTTSCNYPKKIPKLLKRCQSEIIPNHLINKNRLCTSCYLSKKLTYIN